jgi:hypothetical protein
VRAAGETLYLVQRHYDDGWDSIFCNSAAHVEVHPPEWAGPIKAFTQRSRAEALCRELSLKLLETTNPFGDRNPELEDLGFELEDQEEESEVQRRGLADLTTFPPGPFRDWLSDVGLKPPPAAKNDLKDWRNWWKKNHKRMNAEQRHRVLTGLNKLRWYSVIELEPPPDDNEPVSVPRAARGKLQVTVFTVDLLMWKDDDDFLAGQTAAWYKSMEPCFSPRGIGLRLATFRDRDRADAYRDQWQRHIPQHSRRFYRNGFGVSEHTIEVAD